MLQMQLLELLTQVVAVVAVALNYTEQQVVQELLS
jgi:hypothetical protein